MKNTFSHFLILFLLATGISSCDDCPSETEAGPLEILLFENIVPEKDKEYPEYLRDLLLPLECFSDKKINYSFEPISFKRKDLNLDFKLDYLANKPGDPSKVKFVKRQVTNYFKDNKIDSFFIAAPKPSNAYNEWILANKGKNNVFVYSANDELKHEGYIVYNSIDELRNAIGTFAVANPKNKIIIVLAPNNNQTPPPPPGEEVWIGPGDTVTEKVDYHIVLSNAEPFIKNDKDHDYGHPEAYSMLIKACRIAISEKQGEDLAHHLEEACEHGEIVCKKLKPGHENRWRLILIALRENNASLLEQIYDEVKKTRLELINDLLNNKEHDKHHEKH